MMLIEDENKIYMFNRNYSVFQISHLRFPKDAGYTGHLTNTLVDGVREIVLSMENDSIDGLLLKGIGDRQC